MLVLTRKNKESIIINGNIEIKVIEAEDGKVKLGIEAPKEIDIYRKEVYEEILEENKKAALSKLDLKEITKYLQK